MINFLKNIYFSLKIFWNKIKFYWSVNWIKTLYFNFKKFPFKTAKKLPIYFYGKVKFSDISGSIFIDAPIKTGMVGFGQAYEMNRTSIGISEINIKGNLVFKGFCQFGKDYFLYIKKDANCEFGNMSSIAWRGRVICTNSITFGQFARLGSECQVIDTNFHDLINTKTGELYKKSNPIQIGDYNFMSNRITVMKGTVTPKNCSVASNSLCNKNYLKLGQHILIGGIPAKLIKENISRDWKGEEQRMLNHLIIQKKYKL